MIDRRLLALAPEAMKHIVLTVVWLMAGLAANIALVYGIAALLAALIQGSAVPVQETLLLCVVAFVLKIVSAQLSSNERFGYFVSFEGRSRRWRERPSARLAFPPAHPVGVMASLPDAARPAPAARVALVGVEELGLALQGGAGVPVPVNVAARRQIGRASCRERV